MFCRMFARYKYRAAELFDKHLAFKEATKGRIVNVGTIFHCSNLLKAGSGARRDAPSTVVGIHSFAVN